MRTHAPTAKSFRHKERVSCWRRAMGPGWRDFVATNRTVTFSGLVAALEGITIGECHRALCTHVHTRELTRITNDTGMSELLSLSLSLSLSSVTQIRLQHWFSPSLASPMYISRYASLHLPPLQKKKPAFSLLRMSTHLSLGSIRPECPAPRQRGLSRFFLCHLVLPSLSYSHHKPK